MAVFLGTFLFLETDNKDKGSCTDELDTHWLYDHNIQLKLKPKSQTFKPRYVSKLNLDGTHKEVDEKNC